jgi:hypothetical protein
MAKIVGVELSGEGGQQRYGDVDSMLQFRLEMRGDEMKRCWKMKQR